MACSISANTNFKQSGAASLVISLILLVAMTLIATFASRSMVLEQRIVSNVYRDQQAFEAAQAGLEHGVAYVLSGGPDQNGDGALDSISGGTYSSDSLASYTLALTDVSSGGDQSQILVTATGLSDDGVGRRVVQQIAKLVPALPTIPTQPLTSRGNAHLQGSARVIVNLESGVTIWSGGNISFQGAADTRISDGSGGEMVGTDGGGTNNGDTVGGDATLAAMNGDEFFSNFFQNSKTAIKAQATTVLAGDTSGNANSFANISGYVDGLQNQIIWVDGSARINGDTTVGTPTNPVIMIIDGNAKFGGGSTVHGLVYISGNWKHGNGNFDLLGATLIEGEYESAGNPVIVYDSAILANTSKLGGYASAAGSWKDF